jgi:hypothetical protein
MSASGTYTHKSDSYVEVILYTLGPAIEELCDKQQKFTYELDGNKWRLAGELISGLKLEEVWERQTGESAEK